MPGLNLVETKKKLQKPHSDSLIKLKVTLQSDLLFSH